MTRKIYYGPIVDVSFDGAICQHAGECVRGMPSVFDINQRPWIDPRNASDPALADLLRDVVGRCPSGALELEEHLDAEEAEAVGGPVPAPVPTPRALVDVIDNTAGQRFEGWVDGVLAGFAEYQLTDQLVVFTHTEVDPAFEGKGVGSAIARWALDQVRAEGTRRVLAVCPFVLRYIQTHPEYLDITYGARPTSAD